VASVSRPLERRLTALERVPDARGVDFRVFSTVAEADADARPSGFGVPGLIPSPPARCPDRNRAGTMRIAGTGLRATEGNGQRHGQQKPQSAAARAPMPSIACPVMSILAGHNCQRADLVLQLVLDDLSFSGVVHTLTLLIAA
jgi:hypothetical protein